MYTIPVDQFKYYNSSTYSGESGRYYEEGDYIYFLVERCTHHGTEYRDYGNTYIRSLIIKDKKLSIESCFYSDNNTIRGFFERHQTIFSYTASETTYSVWNHHPKWIGESYQGKSYNPSASDKLLTNLFERIKKVEHEIWQQKKKYEEEQKRMQAQIAQQQLNAAKELFKINL